MSSSAKDAIVISKMLFTLYLQVMPLAESGIASGSGFKTMLNKSVASPALSLESTSCVSKQVPALNLEGTARAHKQVDIGGERKHYTQANELVRISDRRSGMSYSSDLMRILVVN